METLFAATSMRRPEDSLGFLFWHVTHAWQRHLDEALLPTGLTHLQFVLLISTAWNMPAPEPLTQAGLARWTQIHPMQVSQVLKILEAKALIRRRPLPDDGRARRIELTDAGIALLAQALPAVDQAHQAFFGRAPGQTEPLRGLLQALLAPRE